MVLWKRGKIKLTRFYGLLEEAKEVYLLTLCDLIVNRITLSSGYEIVVKAIEKCWDWVRTKNVDADQHSSDSRNTFS